MEKNRILFFTNGLYGGGAETIQQTILNNLDANKYDIVLYSVNRCKINELYPGTIRYRYIFDQTDSTNFLYKTYIKIVNKLKLITFNKCSSKLFYKLFVRGNYDSEIAFIEGYATKIVSGSTNKKSKKIAWVHIDLESNHWTKKVYRNDKQEETAYMQFDSVLCVSNNVKDAMKSLFPLIENKLRVCYNPIDENKIKRLSNEKVDEDTRQLNKEIKLISIGRLVSQKGYDRLFPLIKVLKDEGYSVSLRIIGQGKDEYLLERYVRDNELQDVISLLGYKSNPYPYLKESDLFVCSSRSEGYSTVITEALVLGVPVLSTKCSGVGELLGNGEFGYIVENTDEALLEGLRNMISDKKLLEHFREKSVERGAYFKLSNLMKNVEDLI